MKTKADAEKSMCPFIIVNNFATHCTVDKCMAWEWFHPDIAEFYSGKA